MPNRSVVMTARPSFFSLFWLNIVLLERNSFFSNYYTNVTDSSDAQYRLVVSLLVNIAGTSAAAMSRVTKSREMESYFFAGKDSISDHD